MKRSFNILAILVIASSIALSQPAASNPAPKIASVNDLDLAYARASKSVCKALGLPVPKVEVDKRKEPAKRDAIIRRMFQLAQLSIAKTGVPTEKPGLAGKVLVANLNAASLNEIRWLVRGGFLPVNHPLVSASRNLNQRELGRAFGLVMVRISDLAAKKDKTK